MQRVIRITEQFQPLVEERKESFWGDLYGLTKAVGKQTLEEESARLRDVYLGLDPYERPAVGRKDYRNGFYFRDCVTRGGVLGLKMARTRARSFLPTRREKFQRRADEIRRLIREAFLRGISTRQVGRRVAVLPGEALSAPTVSKLSRSLDRRVRAFHPAQRQDEGAYWFLAGVSLRGRRPGGRKRLQRLVA